MTRKIADLAIASGTYTDRNGNEKTRWESVGALWEADCKRMFVTLKRTFAPAGIPVDANGTNRDNVIINVFDASKQKGY